jgi:hypothetical protein
MLMDIGSAKWILDRAVDTGQRLLPRLGSALMGDMWMNLVDARETAQARSQAIIPSVGTRGGPS